MELKHESITLSSLVRRALNPTCSILICFSREGGGVLAPGFLRSLYRRVQGILRSLIRGNGLRSEGDNNLTVCSPLFFLKIVRIERKSRAIDRLCTVTVVVSFLAGVY